jgi:hypothetical protein
MNTKKTSSGAVSEKISHPGSKMEVGKKKGRTRITFRNSNTGRKPIFP